MGWGNLNGPQFEDRLAAVRDALHIEGPPDLAERLHSAVARSTAPLESIRGKKPLQVQIGKPELHVTGQGVGYEGHHASTLAGTGGTILQRWLPRTRGAEEARADDFAHQHHVRDPQLSDPDRRHEHSYETSAAGLTSDRFKAGYQAQRSTRLPEPSTRWGHFDTGRGI